MNEKFFLLVNYLANIENVQRLNAGLLNCYYYYYLNTTQTFYIVMFFFLFCFDSVS